MQRMWDEKYGTEKFFYGTEPNEYFAEKLNLLKTGKILLPGEGEGRNAVFAAKAGWQVLGVDQSFEGKRKALQLAEKENVTITYQLADLLEIELATNSFDAVGCIYFHLPPTMVKSIYKKLSGALQTGGHFIIEVFNKTQIYHASGGPKDIEMLYSAEFIRELLPNYKFIELYETEIMLNEGSGHNGRASVVRGFMQKL